ncbi:hypothetical protein SCLCIDRAFT_144252, partial [Scleroderma citrinum Foug A]
ASSLTNAITCPTAGTGRSHEIHAIFFWLSEISQMLVHPYFIFDGPDRPWFKGGNDRTSGGPRLLVERFQELLDAFGFGWHTAPGEAEAELAFFQLRGLVNVVVTPFNDVLLFGASNVIRSIMLPKCDKYGGVELYTDEAIKHSASLERGCLLLVALMSGADYDRGLPGFTRGIARQLAQYGLGRSLLSATLSLPFTEFMAFHVKWRKQLCEVLETDPQGHLGRTYFELARVIEEEHTEFPNPAILAAYLLPVTSWSDGGQPPVSVVTSRQPDIAALSAFGLQCLGWPREILQMKLTEARAGTVIRALLKVRPLHSCLTILLVSLPILVTRKCR